MNMLIHSRLVKTLLLVLISSFTLAQAPGQTSTMLPDGRALLLGGFNISGEPVSDAFVAAQNGVPQRLQGGLNVARAGHTAAVLPDGTVFIFGGMGTDRQVISRAELFDPATQQFSLLPEVLAVPRAFHTATLLTDGTLLLAGGIEAGGEFPDDV